MAADPVNTPANALSTAIARLMPPASSTVNVLSPPECSPVSSVCVEPSVCVSSSVSDATHRPDAATAHVAISVSPAPGRLWGHFYIKVPPQRVSRSGAGRDPVAVVAAPAAACRPVDPVLRCRRPAVSGSRPAAARPGVGNPGPGRPRSAAVGRPAAVAVATVDYAAAHRPADPAGATVAVPQGTARPAVAAAARAVAPVCFPAPAVVGRKS